MLPNGRPSKKSLGEAQGGLSGGRSSGALGRGRGPAGPEAGDSTGLGAGGKEARRPVQERLRVDLPIRLRTAPERRGFLADPTHGKRAAVLFGASALCRRGGGG